MNTIENWLFDYAYSRAHILNNAPAYDNWAHHFEPFMDPLFAESRPIFLFDGIPDRRNAGGSALWARDGLLPLLAFFSSFNPSEIQRILLVPEEFTWVVPEAWREKVQGYRVRPREGDECLLPQQAKEILVVGCLSPAFVDCDALVNVVNRFRSSLSRQQLAEIRWSFWLPVRHLGLVRKEADHDNLGEFLFELFRDLGSQVRFVEWSTLMSEKNMRGKALLELNERWLVAESFCKHALLGNGAIPLRFVTGAAGRSSKVLRTEPLSPFHELVVTELPALVSETSTFRRGELEDLKKFVNSDWGILDRITAAVKRMTESS